uniref:Uncharacterized protein n=1 Tax=Arundo donax TaxID=35708 RepID=A0A0A9E9Y0_ARUDO
MATIFFHINFCNIYGPECKSTTAWQTVSILLTGSMIEYCSTPTDCKVMIFRDAANLQFTGYNATR